jgi:NADH dehydrogenase FAD-containing subunit
MVADSMPQILFAGGGHTHLAALGALAQRVRGRARLVLVSESSQLLYSGMMPGWLAGRYALQDCAIDLRELAQRAGVEWVTDTLVDIDFQARQAVGAHGTRYGWDLLSLNVGTAVDPGVIRDAALTVLPVKPFGHFVQRWQEWLARAPLRPRCIVVGGGAAAFEVACALRARCAATGPMQGGSVCVISAAPRLLVDQGRYNGWLAARSLRARGIALQCGWRFVGVQGQEVLCERGASPSRQATQAFNPDDEDGKSDTQDGGAVSDVEGAAQARWLRLSADLVIIATGAQTPRWLDAAARRDGLSVGPRGGIAVTAGLRAVSTPRVYASGDCADFGSLRVPKSGVHALRQAPALVDALTAGLDALGGMTPPHTGARYRPQRRALALLDRCDGSAMATWGRLGAAGAGLSHWKTRIDRAFIEAMNGGPPAAR